MAWSSLALGNALASLLSTMMTSPSSFWVSSIFGQLLTILLTAIDGAVKVIFCGWVVWPASLS